MLRIGDLARRAGVTVRTLRHYDELGLLRPEWVDPDTGYRWYATSQIGTVNHLVALKELGFTLEQCRVARTEHRVGHVASRRGRQAAHIDRERIWRGR